MTHERDAVSGAVLAELSRQALDQTAEPLEVDPLELAYGPRSGRIVDLLPELDLAHPARTQMMPLGGEERPRSGSP